MNVTIPADVLRRLIDAGRQMASYADSYRTVVEDSEGDPSKIEGDLARWAAAGVVAESYLRHAANLRAWIDDKPPEPGTECVVLVKGTRPGITFAAVDTWDVLREDPIGMGGPTIETGVGWKDHDYDDVVAWFKLPEYDNG